MSATIRPLPKITKRKHRYADLPPHDDRVYKVADGVNLQLRVFPAFGYQGPDVGATRKGSWGEKGAPWVLYFHGGGFFLGHHVVPYPWVLPSFLSRGYHVVSASYRLAPHASMRDILSDNADALKFCRESLGFILRDMAQALKYESATPLVDIDTYVLGGDSAGGILALLGGHMLSPLPTAIIQSCCVTDMLEYHPTPPACYPPSGKFSDDVLHELMKERDVSKAAIAAPYLSEIPPPLGMGRLPRATLDIVWGPSLASHDGPQGPEADYTEEEILWTARQNDLANVALRDSLTIPTVFRREKFSSEEEYVAEVMSMSPLHLLGPPGSRATRTAATYPPTFIMHGTEDAGVPIHHALRFVGRLRELRRPVAWRYVEGKGHAFDIWIGPGSPGWDIIHEGVEFVDKRVREKKNGTDKVVARL